MRKTQATRNLGLEQRLLRLSELYKHKEKMQREMIGEYTMKQGILELEGGPKGV